ncbi:hypothetical protein EDC01DRAFT_664441 [Geopyxis carbonaria]|nr:hypothetical protein EDC01DRAFT_664441 [Geopyxis carbonaria]
MENSNSEMDEWSSIGSQTTGSATGSQTASNTAGNEIGSQTASNATGSQTVGSTTGSPIGSQTTGHAIGSQTASNATGSTTGSQTASNATGSQKAGYAAENWPTGPLYVAHVDAEYVVLRRHQPALGPPDNPRPAATAVPAPDRTAAPAMEIPDRHGPGMPTARPAATVPAAGNHQGTPAREASSAPLPDPPSSRLTNAEFQQLLASMGDSRTEPSGRRLPPVATTARHRPGPSTALSTNSTGNASHVAASFPVFDPTSRPDYRSPARVPGPIPGRMVYQRRTGPRNAPFPALTRIAPDGTMQRQCSKEHGRWLPMSRFDAACRANCRHCTDITERNYRLKREAEQNAAARMNAVPAPRLTLQQQHELRLAGARARPMGQMQEERHALPAPRLTLQQQHELRLAEQRAGVRARPVGQLQEAARLPVARAVVHRTEAARAPAAGVNGPHPPVAEDLFGDECESWEFETWYENFH